MNVSNVIISKTIIAFSIMVLGLLFTLLSKHIITRETPHPNTKTITTVNHLVNKKSLFPLVTFNYQETKRNQINETALIHSNRSTSPVIDTLITEIILFNHN